MALVTHVSVNKQMFELGTAPMLKVNIVSYNIRVDHLQFILVQWDRSEVLIAHPLHDHLLQLIGFEEVTDKNARLVVREYVDHHWQVVKRFDLFGGDKTDNQQMMASVVNTPVAKASTKPTLTAQPKPSTAHSSGFKPQSVSNEQAKNQCYLDYQGDKTLWRLGIQYAPQWGLSTYGGMLAIVEANPKAFNNGDIHGLRADVRLSCPSNSVIQKYGDADQAKRTFKAM